MFFHKTPPLVTKVFPDIIWHQSREEKNIYLTFDDGPVPEVTPWVLDLLERYDARGTFFMVGENIKKHNDAYQAVVDNGHTIGNHTLNHLNGWKTNNSTYFENINLVEKILNGQSKGLFRPPYGRIKLSQKKALEKEFRIVMWDVLSGDFSNKLSKEDCLEKSIRATRPGSIVVFHDSVRMFEKLKYVLPKYISHFQSLGYSFKAVD